MATQWVSRAATESDQEEWDGSTWVIRWFSPPFDVSGLSGSAMDGTASLTWVNESGHSPDILIERRIPGGEWAEIATLPATATTYEDVGEGSFQYRVVASRTVTGVTKVSTNPPTTAVLVLSGMGPEPVQNLEVSESFGLMVGGTRPGSGALEASESLGLIIAEHGRRAVVLRLPSRSA